MNTPNKIPVITFLEPCNAFGCSEYATLKDSMGNEWCEAHRLRYALINYGYTYGWFDIQCRPFAIGEGYDLWLAAMVMGRDEFIQRAAETLGITGQEHEVA